MPRFALHPLLALSTHQAHPAAVDCERIVGRSLSFCFELVRLVSVVNCCLESFGGAVSILGTAATEICESAVRCPWVLYCRHLCAGRRALGIIRSAKFPTRAIHMTTKHDFCIPLHFFPTWHMHIYTFWSHVVGGAQCDAGGCRQRGSAGPALGLFTLSKATKFRVDGMQACSSQATAPTESHESYIARNSYPTGG